MHDPIVSLADIQREAEKAVEAGLCPYATCLWPADSAAAQIFHRQFLALQVARSDALMHKEMPHV